MAVWHFFCFIGEEPDWKRMNGENKRFLCSSFFVAVYPEENVSEFSTRGEAADYAGRILFNEKGEEVFGFGKYKGRPVAEVFRAEPSYYAWMMNGDFPLYTKKVITEIRMREKTK